MRDGLALKWMMDHQNFEGDECLMWPFGKDRHGYGQVSVRQTGFYRAHQWMCSRANGPAPHDKRLATHTCGNGHLGCVNPKHLRWGTPKSNAKDAADHGRIGFGSAHPSAKFDAPTVALIRIEYLSGLKSMADLAAEHGVRRHTISKAIKGKTYGDIQDVLPQTLSISEIRAMAWKHRAGQRP